MVVFYTPQSMATRVRAKSSRIDWSLILSAMAYVIGETRLMMKTRESRRALRAAPSCRYIIAKSYGRREWYGGRYSTPEYTIMARTLFITPGEHITGASHCQPRVDTASMLRHTVCSAA